MKVVLLICCLWVLVDSAPIVSPKNLVDMSYAFDNTTLYWPTMPRFKLEVVFKGTVSPGGTWYQANKFCAAEHGGTHIDAPNHFQDGQWSVDEIPVERLIAPAVVIDISSRAAVDPDVNVTLADVMEWEKKHGEIPKGAVIFMFSDWGKFWPNATSYFGNDLNDTDNLHFPGFSVEVAEWIVKNRDVYGFGVDSPSVDYGQTRTFATHKVLADKNIYNLENVANLKELPAVGARVFVMPLKIKGGSGGPTRIVAELP